MRHWLRGKCGGGMAFVAIAALVVGGLGWVTAAALRLEQEQLQARADAELQARLQLALSLLDSRVRPLLSREDSRPYNHYIALYAPSSVLANDGNALPPGSVLEPSPLLDADLPGWMLLHFQADEQLGWTSPQVPSPTLLARLQGGPGHPCPVNVTAERARLLLELRKCLPPQTLLAGVQQHGAEPNLHDTTLVLAPHNDFTSNSFNPVNNSSVNPPAQLPGSPQQGRSQNFDPGYLKRFEVQSQVAQENRPVNQRDDLEVANYNTTRNGEDWLGRGNRKTSRGQQVEVELSPLVPFWLRADGRELLLVARVVRIGHRQLCQGILLDGAALQEMLAASISDLFPGSRLLPVHDDDPAQAEGTLRTMTALPLQLDPGAVAAPPAPGWTPLRVGLSLAWAAALVALLAVGLGGWTLLDLSERRIRFVSAVTHELRTPLTTLRLYLDMLTGGMVREEERRREYLHTLHAEADRLNRLVTNVLDFSRLEKQRPRLTRTGVRVGELLEQVQAAWQVRCKDAGKRLTVENSLDSAALLYTDPELLQQVLGNLIDNACKYSQGAADDRIWLRARSQRPDRLVLEVEDQGPGIPACERRTIFRPFRRGRAAEVTAGGVGLGLALARRWTRLLGGTLRLQPGREDRGACFHFELPVLVPSNPSS